MQSTGTLRKKCVVEWDFASSCIQVEEFKLTSPYFSLVTSSNIKMCMFIHGNSSKNILRIGLQRISQKEGEIQNKLLLRVGIHCLGIKNALKICDNVLWYENTLAVTCYCLDSFLCLLDLQDGLVQIRCLTEVVKVVDNVEDFTFENTSHVSSVQKALFYSVLVEDFSALLNDEKYADVSLCVGDEVYRAHRAILAKRCTVFCNKLKHTTSSRSEVKLIIDDIPNGMMKHMLEYIYSGSVGNLTSQEFLTLFVVADTYDLLILKDFCARHLCHTMSTDIALKVIIATIDNFDLKLRTAAEETIFKNAEEIMENDEWLMFMKSHTKYAQELYLQCLHHYKVIH